MANLAAVWQKIHRAGMHLDDLKTEEARFLETKPYRLRVVNDHGHHGQDIINEFVIVDQVAPIPIELPLLVGEVAYQLRSALDHLAWQLVLANNGTPVIKTTAFPVFDTQPKQLKIAGGVDPQALAIVENLQPYKRGQDAKSDPLWMVSELCNIDKHRLLVIVGLGYESVQTTIPGAGPHVMDLPAPIPMELGTNVSTLATPAHVYDSKVEMQAEVSALIAFGKREPCEGERVTDALDRLEDAVSLAVMLFTQFF
jgi:hypothetical protein